MDTVQTSNKSKWGQYLLLIILAIIILVPFVIGFWTSLLPTAEISQGKLFSTNISLRNYVSAITTTSILRYLWNSLVIATLTTLFQLIFCSMSAYGVYFSAF